MEQAMVPIDVVVTSWAVAIALFSGVVHGYSGFGGALLMVPLLTFFLSPVDAVAVTTVAALIGQFSVVRQAVQNANWAECTPFLVGAVVAMPLGTLLLIEGDAKVFQRVVGIATLVAATILGLGWAYKGARSIATSGLFGALGGFVGGATGQGGPVIVAYFMAAPVEPRQQRASIIAAVTGAVTLGLVYLAIGGALPGRTLALGVAIGLPYVAGVWAGSRLFELVPKQNYRRVTLLLLFAAGLAALIR